MILGIVLALIFILIRLSFRGKIFDKKEPDRFRRRPLPPQGEEIPEKWISALNIGNYPLGQDTGFVHHHSSARERSNWPPKKKYAQELASAMADPMVQLRLWSFLEYNRVEGNFLDSIQESFLILDKPGRVVFDPSKGKELYLPMSTVVSNYHFYQGRIAGPRALGSPFFQNTEFSRRPLLAWVRYGERTRLQDIPAGVLERWEEVLEPAHLAELAIVLPGWVQESRVTGLCLENLESVHPACLYLHFSQEKILATLGEKPMARLIAFLLARPRDAMAAALVQVLIEKNLVGQGGLELAVENQSGELSSMEEKWP